MATFFISEKITDKHRIMSQAIKKKVGFSSEEHFQLLWCLMPHRFHCIKTYNMLWLKITT